MPRDVAPTRTLAKICLGVGIIIAVGAVWFLSRSVVLYATGAQTQGRITGAEQVLGKNNQMMYAATFEFDDANGNRHTVTSRIRNNSAPPLGTQVRVIYDPNNPGNAEIKSITLWVMPVAACLIGTLAAVWGFVTLRR